MKIVKFLFIVLGFFILAACVEHIQHREQRVDLKPRDSRPLLSVDVDDYKEVELLKQQLNLEPVLVKGMKVYFFEDRDIVKKLEEIGYSPVEADPHQVFQRVVRVERKGSEDELLRIGVLIINREPKYWVVRGNLAQLLSLERMEYRITKVGRNEPLPRGVRVLVRDEKEIIWLRTIQVDIYSVERTNSYYEVYGGAFDYQIDRIQKKGLKVDLISTIRQERKK